MQTLHTEGTAVVAAATSSSAMILHITLRRRIKEDLAHTEVAKKRDHHVDRTVFYSQIISYLSKSNKGSIGKGISSTDQALDMKIVPCYTSLVTLNN
uniref:Uncharacterized protein n=1 Tax=Glossina palpalis gambiensis TaxID=67801 RepID=A0A1B0AZV9_9MUSC